MMKGSTMTTRLYHRHYRLEVKDGALHQHIVIDVKEASRNAPRAILKRLHSAFSDSPSVKEDVRDVERTKNRLLVSTRIHNKKQGYRIERLLTLIISALDSYFKGNPTPTRSSYRNSHRQSHHRPGRRNTRQRFIPAQTG